MNRKFPLILTGVLILIATFIFVPRTFGDSLSDLDKQLDQTQEELQKAKEQKDANQKALDQLKALKAQYENSLVSMQQSYQSTKQQVAVTQESIKEKEAELEKVNAQIDETEKLINERLELMHEAIRQMYMQQAPGWLSHIFAAKTLKDLTKNLIYKRAVTYSIKRDADNLGEQLQTIQDIREVLAKIKDELTIQKQELVAKQNALQGEISKTQSNLAAAQARMQDLNQALIGIDEKINQLTQKQRDILARKAAAALASTSVGNIEIDEAAIEKSPPKDGKVYFSFWTYGYPHRVGLSQYGALGRAVAGQTADEIIKAYFKGVELQKWDAPKTITLTDGRTLPFEDKYLLGIGEMPSCWGKPDRGGIEILKVQAIISRTYALKYTNNGQNPICTTQQCQVYVGDSKVNGLCGEYWREAVESTRGIVITYQGEPIEAWYSIGAGGFTLTTQQVWGGYRPYSVSIADFDAKGKPYEGKDYAGSPWYHKAWGDEPWLSIEQVTDLANAALLPESYNNQIGELTSSEIVDALNKSGITPITNFNAIEVLDENGKSGANTAQTKTVRVYFNNGSVVDIDANRFKFVFNLKSPGTDAIWTTRFDILTAADL